VVAGGRIAGATDVATESSYEAHGISKSSGFVESFFLA
jgi:hypothetical protein